MSARVFGQCLLEGCWELTSSPLRSHCDHHAEEAARYRADPSLLDGEWLTEMCEQVSPVIPRYLIELVRRCPLSVPSVVQDVKRDPREAAQEMAYQLRVLAQHPLLANRPSAACDVCGSVGPAVSGLALPISDAGTIRVCLVCARSADAIAYRANPWWCPRCRARPDSLLCACRDASEPLGLRWARRIARSENESPDELAAGVYLTLAEREKEPRGIRVGKGKQPVAIGFRLDELGDAMLAFVLAQLARRHRKRGELGPGWRRRRDGMDVPFAPGNTPRARGRHLEARVLGRLHASRNLAKVLRLATQAQRRAVEHLSDGATLDGKDRDALYHLRRKLSADLSI